MFSFTNCLTCFISFAAEIPSMSLFCLDLRIPTHRWQWSHLHPTLLIPNFAIYFPTCSVPQLPIPCVLTDLRWQLVHKWLVFKMYILVFSSVQGLASSVISMIHNICLPLSSSFCEMWMFHHWHSSRMGPKFWKTFPNSLIFLLFPFPLKLQYALKFNYLTIFCNFIHLQDNSISAKQWFFTHF